MEDVQVPPVPYVSAYKIGKSEARDATSCLASLSAYALPNIWQDLPDLASFIYERYCGADQPGNATLMTKEQILSWCSETHIGTFLVNGPASHDELRLELFCMLKSHIPVLLLLADGSQLLTVDGKPLHPFKMTPAQHAIVLLGFQNDGATALILDPAAPCPPLPYPTPCAWESLVAATINAAIGVMPPAVAPPPTGFRFWQADSEQVWPTPTPSPDRVAEQLHVQTLASRADFLASVEAAVKDLANQYSQQEDGAFLKTLQALGLKGE